MDSVWIKSNKPSVMVTCASASVKTLISEKTACTVILDVSTPDSAPGFQGGRRAQLVQVHVDFQKMIRTEGCNGLSGTRQMASYGSHQQSNSGVIGGRRKKLFFFVFMGDSTVQFVHH